MTQQTNMQLDFKSQIGQDKWVCDFFNYKRFGFFLDIGAFDGISISNTWVLEKQLEWNGICIEAGVNNLAQLAKTRYPVIVHCAVTDFMGEVHFHEHSGLGKISTFGEQVVDAMTIDYIMKMHNCPKHIDYVSLDVEGNEVKVLSKFPFEEYDVDLWTIEHNLYSEGPQLKNEIHQIMKRNGYIRVNEDVGAYRNGIFEPFEDWYMNKRFAAL